MREIDKAGWNRIEQFEFFHRMDFPQFHLTVELEITRFRAFLKEQGLPFHYAMNFLAAEAADRVENFRYRIRGDRIILHDKTHVSLIEPMGEDLFKLVLVERRGGLRTFCQDAAAKSAGQTTFLVAEDEERDDLIYTTCLPWFSFTELGHGIVLDRDDSVPRISWGKYFTREGKMLLPLSVQVNHALVDGAHVAKYLKAFQELLDNGELIT